MKGDGDLARALRRGDVDEARRIEKRRRISTLRFGIQAFLEGRPDIAVTSACRRLRADPDDSDHRVLCALAADLAGQHEVFDEAWRRAPGMPRPLGPLGRLMLVELLFRHGGLDAARPGIAALSSVRRQVTEDPLARALLVRVLPGEPARRGKRR